MDQPQTQRMTTIHIAPDKDLIRVLTALGIRWDLTLSGNGDGNWVSVEMDEKDDQRLLDVWNQLTTLRLLYIEAMQYNQLPLWEEAG